MKTIKIKGKDYVEVNERVKYFKENYPNWSIESDIFDLKNDRVIFKAVVKDETERVRSSGWAYETEGSTFINKTSFIENCETSAVGRALGFLGIGIDTSIASKEEVETAILNRNKPKFTNEIFLAKVKEYAKVVEEEGVSLEEKTNEILASILKDRDLNGVPKSELIQDYNKMQKYIDKVKKLEGK